ncbi:hypothetical protein [Hymenobacter weizhouensis]|uniref:hypothetical protein n=1 Tax=Hymenobacter sp. YIM 151500-1 TaxID=2987689 RepID=UPI0022268B17|nr:hypothetical protein [Hymenobacter sp. YIM 151500-1]UYZ64677.1 hypothetical protein OIS53_07465 [Hymenobacter sp. YIM 151500-1]
MKRFLLLALLALPLLPACQFDAGVVACEDGTTPGPSPVPPATLQELRQQLGAPAQSFTYDPTRVNTFTGAKGTVVTIAAGAFHRNGQPVAGPVPMHVREILSRADMVLSAVPTVSNGQVLQSAGAVFVGPAQDSSLQLGSNSQIRLQVPTPPNVPRRDSMSLFVAPPATNATACFNWLLNTTPGSFLRPTAAGNEIIIGNALYNQGIRWFNCDRFYGTPAPVTITVNVPGSNIDPRRNTLVFAVFRAFNGALQLCTFSPPNSFQASRLPLGQPISVVVIRTVDGKLYYGRQDGTAQAGQVFTPQLSETTTTALVANLNGL